MKRSSYPTILIIKWKLKQLNNAVLTFVNHRIRSLCSQAIHLLSQ
jgi:hypothetical protein